MPQGSTEWLGVRLGVVTASEIDALVTPEWKLRTGDGVKTYLHEKLSEKIMGYGGTGSTWAMGQGQLLEDEVCPWLTFAHGIAVQKVGFCQSDDLRTGCSPDGLIGDDCGLEIKCPQPPQHIRYLLDNEVPKAYRAQVQMSMFVTGRPAWMFVSYSRYMPKLILRVERDPIAQEAIGKAVTAFIADYDAAFAKISALMPQSNGRE